MILRLADWTAAGIVVTREADGERLDPTTAGSIEEKVALDLYIGDVYWDAPGPRTPRQVHDHIIVDGAKAVRIRTRESFSVPANVFGQTVSRTSLTWSGVVAANIKIDPKFSGCLQITLFNVGTDRVVLKVAEPFCSVVFQRIEHEVEGEARHAPADPYLPYNRLTGFYHRYRLALATVIVAIVASVIGGVIVNRFGPPPELKQPPAPTSPAGTP